MKALVLSRWTLKTNKRHQIKGVHFMVHGHRTEAEEDRIKAGRRTLSVSRPTPWGISDSVVIFADGIELYHTPSHGGFWLSNERLKELPDYMSDIAENGRWFEEDCNWSVIPLAFPDYFTTAEIAKAVGVCRNWLPEVYEANFDVVIPPGQSAVKDRQRFEEENKDKWMVVSAITDSLDTDMVCVMVTKGGQRTDAAWKNARYILVPKEEYRAVPNREFVVHEERYEEVDEDRFYGRVAPQP